VTYTISVTNNGNAPQTGIVVQDALPGAPLTFVSASCPAGLTPVNGVLTWTLPSTAADQTRTCTVVMNVPAGTPIGTSFSNTASLLVNGLQIDSVSVTTTVSNEQITIQKISSKNPVSSNPAETFAYNLIVTNNGNATAMDITVVDTLPAQLNGPVWNAFAIGSFSCTNAADVVTCSGGDLGPGSSVVIAIPVTLAAQVADGFDIVNTATVTECTIGAVACAENPSSSTTTQVLNHPVLSMVKVADSDPIVAGGVAAYTITIANTGGSDAEVIFDDAMPAALENLSIDQDGGLTCTEEPNNVIHCEGTVGAGDVVTIRISGDVPADTDDGAVLINEAP
jgi:uncharacterized repeat protein (TIGR01451 family)